jgi:hypothetical protein
MKRRIDADQAAAQKAPGAFTAAMAAAIAVGSGEVSAALQRGELGLQPGKAQGMAGDVAPWMIDPDIPMGAIGVPQEAASFRYAKFLDDGGSTGGRIYPKTARNLAIPVSEQAKKMTSPLDMPNLTLIPRRGRPPLLVEMLSSKGGRREQWRIHWVLLASVYIQPRHWLSKGVQAASAMIGQAFERKFYQVMRTGA